MRSFPEEAIEKVSQFTSLPIFCTTHTLWKEQKDIIGLGQVRGRRVSILKQESKYHLLSKGK
jgi:hypothetical protein